MGQDALSDFIHLTLSALMFGAAIFILIFFNTATQTRETVLVNDANEKSSVLSSYLNNEVENRLKNNDMTLSKSNMYTDILAEMERENISIAINGTNLETILDINKLKAHDKEEIGKLKNNITNDYYQKKYFYKVKKNNEDYINRTDFNEFSDIANELDLTHINYVTYQGENQLYNIEDTGEPLN